jgi:hypothetical protein
MLFAEWSTKESMHGFYSDSYKGEEIYDKTLKEWKLISGNGSGNGESSYMSNLSLEGEIFLAMAANPVTSYTSPPGSYQSSEQIIDKQIFQSKFTVADGEWQNRFTGQDIGMVWAHYNTNVSGSYTFIFDMSLGNGEPYIVTQTQENSFGGTMNHVTSSTTDWKMENGERTDLRKSTLVFQYETNSRYFLNDYQYPSYETKNHNNNDHTLLRMDRTTWTPDTGKVTSHFGFGTASGDRYMLDSSGEATQNYKGRIERDAQTGDFSGRGVATTASAGHPLLPQSHGAMQIDYNDFTHLRGNVDLNANCGNVGNAYTQNYPLLNCIIPPHQNYYKAVTVTYGSDGANVTFDEPLTIPAGTFDSGLDKFLPKQEPPEYEASDVSDVVPI